MHAPIVRRCRPRVLVCMHASVNAWSAHARTHAPITSCLAGVLDSADMATAASGTGRQGRLWGGRTVLGRGLACVLWAAGEALAGASCAWWLLQAMLWAGCSIPVHMMPGTLRGKELPALLGRSAYFAAQH